MAVAQPERSDQVPLVSGLTVVTAYTLSGDHLNESGKHAEAEAIHREALGSALQ